MGKKPGSHHVSFVIVRFSRGLLCVSCVVHLPPFGAKRGERGATRGEKRGVKRGKERGNEGKREEKRGEKRGKEGQRGAKKGKEGEKGEKRGKGGERGDVIHRASSALTFGFPASALPARSRVLLCRCFSLDAFEHIGVHRSESRFQLVIVPLRR